MNLLLLRANQNILPKFLYYLLNSQILKKQLPSITKKSVNQASMSTTNLGNLNVIYPINKNEQQEIVDVLDAASEIIRLRTACIESAQSLIPALFQEMFGDPLSKVDKNKIGYYFDVGTGATPRRENSEYYEGNIPWVKTTEIDNCYINSTSEHISESAIKETNCSLYPPGTILMAMYGQGKTRGKVAYLNISATICIIGMLASFAFATPPSMPHIAIISSSQSCSTKDVFLYGLILMIISIVISLVVAYPLGTLIF